jgi:hypothetical protein
MAKSPSEPGNTSGGATSKIPFSTKKTVSKRGSYIKEKKNHKCPDFLNFEFTKKQPNKDQTVDLGLTIVFGHLEQPLWFGKAIFGLRGGKLYVEVNNGQIPLDRRYPQQNFKEISSSVTEKTQVTNRTAGGIGQSGGSLNLGREKVSEVSKTFQFDEKQLYVVGDETNSIWHFNSGHQDCLMGQYNCPILGTLKINEFPCQVDAKFRIEIDDLQVIEAKGLYSPDETTSKTKRCTLDRLIINHTLGRDIEFKVGLEKKKCSDYLSLVSLCYEPRVI